MNELSIESEQHDSDSKISDYVIGEVYFFVTYPDSAMFFPLVESYIFLGKNFSEEDVFDTWYFQPALDFSKFGSAIQGRERPVFCAKIDQLNEFQNEDQLAVTMKKASARRAGNRPYQKI